MSTARLSRADTRGEKSMTDVPGESPRDPRYAIWAKELADIDLEIVREAVSYTHLTLPTSDLV